MWDIALHFEEAFRSNCNSLCNVAFNLIKTKNAVEDLAQEIFLKLWQKKNSLVIRADHRSYLYKVTIDASLNYLKHNVTNVKPDACNSHSLNENPKREITAWEPEKNIEAAIKRLLPKWRVIFILSRHEGTKYKEIAEHQGDFCYAIKKGNINRLEQTFTLKNRNE